MKSSRQQALADQALSIVGTGGLFVGVTVPRLFGSEQLVQSAVNDRHLNGAATIAAALWQTKELTTLYEHPCSAEMKFKCRHPTKAIDNFSRYISLLMKPLHVSVTNKKFQGEVKRDELILHLGGHTAALDSIYDNFWSDVRVARNGMQRQRSTVAAKEDLEKTVLARLRRRVSRKRKRLEELPDAGT